MKKLILLSIVAGSLATASFAGNAKTVVSPMGSEKVQIIVNGQPQVHRANESVVLAKAGTYQMKVTVYKNGRPMYSYTERVEVKKGARQKVRMETKKVKKQEALANRPVLVNHQKLYLRQHFS
jgi:hypothetical protein